MEKIRLYTKEQVETAILDTFFDCKIATHLKYKSYENIESDILSQLTPIELPSDEEIRNELQFASRDYFFGALWMKEQIKQQVE